MVLLLKYKGNTKQKGSFYFCYVTRYYTIPVPESLTRFVRFFWVFEMDLLPGQEYVYRSMADSCTEIVFHYKGNFEELTDTGLTSQPNALLHAQSHQYKRFLTRESFGIFGAFLYPYVIPYLFNLSSYEAVGQIADLKLLCGNKGRILEEQMMLAADNLERVAVFSKFLHQKLCDKQPEDRVANCVKRILLSDSTLPVKDLANHANLSVRQLERTFKDYVGLSPKLFSRIVRFHSALKQYNSSGTLTEIAYDCGYYDQSHFIHDFKQFSGYHPKQYFFGKPEGIEWREA